MTSPRIFEEVIVVDDDGSELYRFKQEMDPRFYVLMNIPPEAETVTRRRHLTAEQTAQEFPLRR